MDYKEELRKRVEVVTEYDADDVEFSQDIGLNPGEVSVGFTVSNLEEFLDAYILDKTTGENRHNIPLLPTDEPVDSVADLVALAEKVDINVYPDTVGVDIEIYEPEDESDGDKIETVIKFTPYYTVRALALFDLLADGVALDPVSNYSIGYFDPTEASNSILAWLATEVDIQIDETADGTEIIAKLLSKLYNTEVSFNGFSEIEDIESADAKEAAKNGECIMLTCLEFKMSQEVFEATQGK